MAYHKLLLDLGVAPIFMFSHSLLVVELFSLRQEALLKAKVKESFYFWKCYFQNESEASFLSIH